MYEVDADLITLGYWSEKAEGFFGLAHQISPAALVLEYSAEIKHGTARATRAVNRTLSLAAEMAVILENRCSDCHEQLFESDSGWIHEDNSPVCGCAISLRNTLMEDRLRDAEIRLERER